MRIVVVGLGKIGLPLAVQYAGAGHRVIGLDIAPEVVDAVSAGREPFPGEAELDVRLSKVVADGSLSATTDYAEAIGGADVIVVVVPLVVDASGKPDFGLMDTATGDIAAHLTRGTTVIYETTLPVGTTRGRWKPALEVGSGLVEGEDFCVVFSPERVLTGRVFADLRKYPKLVGALGPEGAERAAEFYRAVLTFDERSDLPVANGVWDLGSAEAAELVKLAETTYRDVNIGLANQFARFADSAGIDIYKVIEAANSQPYSHLHRPGIAVGGHCIPVYPRLYLWNDPDASIVAAARDANAGMPWYAVGRLEEALGALDGVRVVVLGAAYRGGVKETAFSGVFGTVDALRERGAVPLVHDPLFSDEELRELGFEPYRFDSASEAPPGSTSPAGSTESAARVDAAILQADHESYRRLRPADLPGLRVLLDGRAVTDPADWPGVIHRVVGAGGNPTAG